MCHVKAAMTMVSFGVLCSHWPFPPFVTAHDFLMGQVIFSTLGLMRLVDSRYKRKLKQSFTLVNIDGISIITSQWHMKLMAKNIKTSMQSSPT